MHRITSTITLADHEIPPGFDPGANAWNVQLRYRGRTMSFPFYTGSMFGEPHTSDAVGNIAMTATSIDNARTFEEWAEEFGDDPDSRRAEKAYHESQKLAVAFKRLLRDDYTTIAFADEDTLRRTYCRDDA